jgi:hypothetical protein
MHNFFYTSLEQLFLLLFSKKYAKFKLSLQNPEQSQRQLKKRILQSVNKTSYYKEYYKNDWNDFPVSQYENLEKFIVPHQSGLIQEKVLFWEKTSGSSGKKKLIPYTSSFLALFGRMLIFWGVDLLKNKKLKLGKIFFLISPSLDSESKNTSEMKNDLDYLNPFLKFLLSPLIIDLKGISSLTSEEYYHFLAVRLISEEKLKIISVWSPSFLLVLTDYIKKNWPLLRKEIEDGQMIINGQVFRVRQRELKNITLPLEQIRLLFPSLEFISCWGSAQAERDYQRLEKIFPSVYLQKKGLLATEAPMTVPLCQLQRGAVPLVQDVYFEFIDAAKKIHLLHQLVLGETYEIVISHMGGFIRYHVGDKVRVEGYIEATPVLEFIGRSGNTSDLAGEKFGEEFINHLSQKMSAELQTVVAVNRNNFRGYLFLFEQSEAECPSVADIEVLLRESYHYQQARSLGQLQEVKTVTIPKLSRQLQNYYLRKGIKLGDQKNKKLFNATEGFELLTYLAIEIEFSH